jgi:hypothetical protein
LFTTITVLNELLHDEKIIFNQIGFVVFGGAYTPLNTLLFHGRNLISSKNGVYLLVISLTRFEQ